MTPLCYVIFPPGGYGYSFPVPTAFNPPMDRIKRLFLECKDLTKRFKRHGRRMSLHEILCDLYECDPKTTWLSDEELIMLPIWLPHIRPINRIVEDASSAIYTTFFQLFSSDSLLSWDDKTAKSYTE
uniref:Uncharacterized protein n=1 Tax=Acrobeloides nanus TaxID=290746 RepID=A0A914DBH7_9BILA